MSQQVEEHKDLLKACCKDDEDMQYALLLALELFLCKEEKGFKKFETVTCYLCMHAHANIHMMM